MRLLASVGLQVLNQSVLAVELAVAVGLRTGVHSSWTLNLGRPRTVEVECVGLWGHRFQAEVAKWENDLRPVWPACVRGEVGREEMGMGVHVLLLMDALHYQLEMLGRVRKTEATDPATFLPASHFAAICRAEDGFTVLYCIDRSHG